MIADLQPYPAMKDSGVEWLGKVPAHWRTAHVRRYCRVFAGATPSRSVAQYWDGGSIPWLSSGDVNLRRIMTVRQFITEAGLQNSSANWIRPGSLVLALAGQGKTKGMVATVEVFTTCNQSLAAIEPDKRESRYEYLAYYLESRYRDIRALVGDGLRDGLNLEHVRAIPTPLPSLAEQAAIVRFLGHADRRIRRYIRAKQKLITLLEEQKQAVIHQAVIGQIDVRTGEPYPSYKASREEWLEVVPAHWEIRRLKSLVRRIDQGVSPQAENYHTDGDAWGVLKVGCVNGGVFRETEHKRLAPDFVFDPVLVVTTGDVLVSRANGSPHLVGSVGRVSSLRHQLILSDKTFRPIFNQEIEPDFMVLAMNSRYYRQQVEQAISGAEGLANNLPLSSLRSFHFAVPTFEEQHDIVRYLKESTHRLSAVAARTKREVALLDEYRTRLIADVVTGKLDVRGVAAELPEPDAPADDDTPDGIRAASGLDTRAEELAAGGIDVRHGEVEGRGAADAATVARWGAEEAVAGDRR